MKIMAFPVLFVTLVAGTAAAAETWQAGLAQRKITPAQRVYLAGYASRNKPFESVADDLYLKALALVDPGGHRAVIVTSDLIGFRAEFAEPICERIQEATGLGRAQILLNSSHTHSGPLLTLDPTPRAADMTEDQAQATVAYTRELVEHTVAVAVEALGNTAPARLSYGRGVAHFVMNRREFTPQGVRLGVNPSGLADRSVPVLRIDDADGRLRAVLFGAACHNTTLTGRHFIVSGDYAGAAQRHVQEQYPDVQAMFLLGCGGSANPYPRGEWDHVLAHGTELGREVCRVAAGERTRLEGSLRTEFALVDLPLARPPSAEEIERLAAGGSGWQSWVARQMRETLERDGALPTAYRCPVAVWQIGPLTLVGLSGEVVVDYVPLIEQALGPLDLWIAAYCNDVFGYLPSQQVLAEGGYETRGLIYGGVGFFAPDAEQALIDEVRRLARAAGRKTP